MRIIKRQHTRTERDDWVLNVAPYMDNTEEALPIYHENILTGWRIQTRYS